MDMASDEASAENGGSRRPGNLWTVEAREDMFRRREAGETWETICQVSWARPCCSLLNPYAVRTCSCVDAVMFGMNFVYALTDGFRILSSTPRQGVMNILTNHSYPGLSQAFASRDAAAILCKYIYVNHWDM